MGDRLLSSDDYQGAIFQYEKAKQHGDLSVNDKIGECYYLMALKERFFINIPLLIKAATFNNDKARIRLGTFACEESKSYAAYNGITDLSKLFDKVWLQLADGGDAFFQYLVGIYYYGEAESVYIKQRFRNTALKRNQINDFNKSYTYFKKSADQSHPGGQFGLGIF